MEPRAERHCLGLAELQGPQEQGDWLRARCPIHGGDHQRSLSIRMTGEGRGFGQCFACHARVMVRELVLASTGWGKGGQDRKRPLVARDMLAPPRREWVAQTSPPAPSWQEAERKALHAQATRWQAELLRGERARCYLVERKIDPGLAEELGVGYVPRGVALPKAWLDRLIFPLRSPTGIGYIGRSLEGWEPGMDEYTHKSLLERRGIRRWYKTNPAGWFVYSAPKREASASAPIIAERLVLVEGPMDALALVMCGVNPWEVVALSGTAGQVSWIPPQIRQALLAFDTDQAGHAGAHSLALALTDAGLRVGFCSPPADGMGKDWSERWRRAEWEGMVPMFAALADGLAR